LEMSSFCQKLLIFCCYGAIKQHRAGLLATWGALNLRAKTLS
jgi:hypothetical protein